MKILKLRFKNINSLKGENSIDFSAKPFVDAGIFAIVGPTGAGKSSILDVITLALFNRTPRTGALSSNLIESLGAVITRNTDDAFAEIDYETDGKKYRSNWSIHRAKSGKLQDYNMVLSEIDKSIFDVKKSEIPAKNAEIIGLSFDQFVKSILLSQGEFAAFLKANSDERSELLEKITGISIYRQIGKAVFEKQKSEKELLDRYLDRNQNLKLLSPEQRAEITDRFENLKIREISISNEKKETEKKLAVKYAIKKIESELVQLQTEKFQIDLQAQAMKNDRNLLEKHENFAPLKSEIDSCFRLIFEIKEADLKINMKNDILAEKNTQKSKFIEILNHTKNLKNAVIKDFENIKPILEDVRAAESKIIGIDQNLKELKAEKEKKGLEIHNFTKSLNELAEKSAKNLLLKQKLEKSNIEHAFLGDLNAELSLLNENLFRYRKDSENSLSALRNLSVNSRGKFQNPKNSVETSYQIQSEIHELNKEKNQVSEILHGNDASVSEIDFKISDLRSEFSVLRDLKNLTEKYFFLADKKSKSENEIKEIYEKLDLQTININEIKQKTKHLTHLISEYELLIQKQNFEKKYEDDRKNLKPDEPCFLCGSKHHPYVLEYVKHSNETQIKLDSLKNELQKYDELRFQTEKQISDLQANIEYLKKQISDIKIEIDDIVQKFRNIDHLNRFELNINTISAFSTKMEEIEIEGKQLKHISESKTKYEKLIGEQRELEILLDKFNSVAESEKYLSSKMSKYSKFCNGNQSFEQQIDELAQKLIEFNFNLESLKKTENNIVSDENLKIEKISYLQSLKPELERLNLSILDKENQIHGLNEEIKLKLNGKNAKDIENQFNSSIQNIETEIEINGKSLNAVISEMSAETAVLSKLLEDLESNRRQLENIKENLVPELGKLNCLNIEDAKQNLLENSVYEEIKFRKEKTQKQMIEIASKINQKTENLEEQTKLDFPEMSIQELEKFLAEAENSVKEVNQTIGTLHNQLSADNKLRLQASEIEQLIANQQKETNRWSILNNLIGDATGKKYAKFAQELTMIQLIAMANKHLHDIFGRYYIKKSTNGNTDLLIVDTFLADTERSVKTLSGGESFMVSLALALALSDLAGQNTRIDSLFIDEGFGTLDAEAQEAAMAALENLQSKTNRTIGIISHIQALKDRIPVQIQVKKTGNGYSKIVLSD